MQLMMMLAPIVMAYLGNRSRQQGMDSQGLGGLLGQQTHQISSAGGIGGTLMNAVLDKDGDGDVDFSDILAAACGRRRQPAATRWPRRPARLDLRQELTARLQAEVKTRRGRRAPGSGGVRACRAWSPARGSRCVPGASSRARRLGARATRVTSRYSVCAMVGRTALVAQRQRLRLRRRSSPRRTRSASPTRSARDGFTAWPPTSTFDGFDRGLGQRARLVEARRPEPEVEADAVGGILGSVS